MPLFYIKDFKKGVTNNLAISILTLGRIFPQSKHYPSVHESRQAKSKRYRLSQELPQINRTLAQNSSITQGSYSEIQREK